MRYQHLYYISFKIEEKYLIGYFKEEYNAKSAINSSMINVKNKLNVNYEDIKVNYVRNIDIYSIIDICNSILKIEPKYSKFLIERTINSELSYLLSSCFSNDIKKLILPGNIGFKIEMISKHNKYIELVYKPSIEMQNLITESKYIRYIENPSVEIVKKAIMENSIFWLAENIDLICGYQSSCFETFKEMLNIRYIQRDYGPETVFVEKVLLSKLNLGYKIFCVENLCKRSFLSIEFLIKNFEQIVCNTDSEILDCLIKLYPILIFKMNFLTRERKIILENKVHTFNFSNEIFNSGKVDLVKYIENYEIETMECRKKLLLALPQDLKFSEKLNELINMYYLSLSDLDRIDIFLYIFDKIEICNEFYKKLIEFGVEQVSHNIDKYSNYWWKFTSLNNKIIDLVFRKITLFPLDEIAEISKKISKNNFKYKQIIDREYYPVRESTTDIYEIIINNKLQLEYKSKEEISRNFGWSGDNEWTNTITSDYVEIFIGNYHFEFFHCFSFEDDLYVSKFLLFLMKLNNF